MVYNEIRTGLLTQKRLLHIMHDSCLKKYHKLETKIRVFNKKKRGKSMSIIYSFLQKRKLHESQYGFIMVFAAYIIAAVMLVLGSDVFYNINSAAAGISLDTEEETRKLNEVQLLDERASANYPISLMKTNLINPYGISDIKQNQETRVVSSSISGTGDTIWLLGNSMDEETFNSLFEQAVSLNPADITEHSVSKSGKSKTKAAVIEEKVRTAYGSITKKEISMLERIVEAEASGEDMIGKILIANVIFNRIEDDTFPDTVEDVIFQKTNGDYQFSPLSDDRYWSVKVSKSTKKAVERALEGEDYSKGALYFVAKKRTSSKSARWFDTNLDWLFKHGGHEFYKNK